MSVPYTALIIDTLFHEVSHVSGGQSTASPAGKVSDVCDWINIYGNDVGLRAGWGDSGHQGPLQNPHRAAIAAGGSLSVC